MLSQDEQQVRRVQVQDAPHEAIASAPLPAKPKAGVIT